MFSGEPRPAAGDNGEYPGVAPVRAFAFGLPGAAAALEEEAWAEDEDTPVADADAVAEAAEAAEVAAAATIAAAAAGLPSIIIICGVGGVGSSLAFICNVLCTSMTDWPELTLFMAMALPNLSRDADDDEEVERTLAADGTRRGPCAWPAPPPEEDEKYCVAGVDGGSTPNMPLPPPFLPCPILGMLFLLSSSIGSSPSILLPSPSSPISAKVTLPGGGASSAPITNPTLPLLPLLLPWLV